MGKGVQETLGDFEYEWYWTVNAKDIQPFETAIGGDGDILQQLEALFKDEKAAGIVSFMQNNNIPFESWSRTGD